MTQGEKATRYDEALERAKVIHRFSSDLAEIKRMEQIFPELKESEDEKIRKGILNYLIKMWGNSQDDICGVNVEDAIAWLEKQGEKEQDPCEHCNDKCLNCHNFPCVDKREFERGKSAMEAIKEENVDNANKVEPKFKVGDWVIFAENHNSVYQVEIIDNNRYYLRHYLGGTLSVHFDNELIRLWTIQDAKDGDVLAIDWIDDFLNVWEKIVIFKSLSKNGVEGYGCTFKNKENIFDVNIPFHSKTWTKNLHPATKEQRDLLFTKMKEAGYEWDDKEKKPIKS